MKNFVTKNLIPTLGFGPWATTLCALILISPHFPWNPIFPANSGASGRIWLCVTTSSTSLIPVFAAHILYHFDPPFLPIPDLSQILTKVFKLTEKDLGKYCFATCVKVLIWLSHQRFIYWALGLSVAVLRRWWSCKSWSPWGVVKSTTLRRAYGALLGPQSVLMRASCCKAKSQDWSFLSLWFLVMPCCFFLLCALHYCVPLIGRSSLEFNRWILDTGTSLITTNPQTESHKYT